MDGELIQKLENTGSVKKDMSIIHSICRKHFTKLIIYLQKLIRMDILFFTCALIPIYLLLKFPVKSSILLSVIIFVLVN